MINLDSEIEEQNIYGNVWIFPVVLNSGEEKTGHKHEFDHVHQVVSGKATIICYSDLCMKIEMYKVVIEAGKYYRVPKEHIHRIVADHGVNYVGNCIHALRDKNDEVHETNMIDDIDNGDIEIVYKGD